MTTPDEGALVARLRQGDGAAFEMVVRLYGPRMRATARRYLGGEDDADDTVQEAFLSAFQHLASFRGGARFGAWLHRILINAALMRLRSRPREPRQEIDDLLPAFAANGGFSESQAAFGSTAADESERRNLLDHVRRKIAELPDRHRVPLVLQHVEGLDNEQLAATLGITVNAAKIRLHRARQALRTLLEPRLAGGRP